MTQLHQPSTPACHQLNEDAPSCSQQQSPATFLTQAARRQSNGGGNKRKSSVPAPEVQQAAEDGSATVPKRSRKSLAEVVKEQQQPVQQEEQTCSIATAEAQQTVLSCGKAMLGTVFSPLFSALGRGQQHAAVAARISVAGDEDEQDVGGNENATGAGVGHDHHHAHHPPPPEVPEAAESDYDDDDEGEEEYVDFDPLVFIKTLPPLETCTPRFRQALLPRQTRQCKRKTLVLDLDETLVHSSLESAALSDFSFPVTFNNQEHTIHVRQRPHLHEFMARVSELFEIVVFTASQKIYAEKLLNIIDPGPQRYIKHRIYRDSCVIVDGNYLKDLSVLGRDLANTLIVDNSPQAFGFQIDNGVPIESWYEDPADDELPKLLPFLESLVDVDDVRPHIASKFKLRELIERAF